MTNENQDFLTKAQVIAFTIVGAVGLIVVALDLFVFRP